MSESLQAESAGKPGFTRRRFIIGSVGVTAVAAMGGTTVRAPRAFAASPPSGPPTTTLPLPTTTEPEQLLLTWGANPATDVTVSWSAPGTVAQPAPTLAFSTRPVTAGNPGHLVKLPDPAPLDVTQRYGEAASVSFADGLNGQTTYFYHVQLKGLKPGTRYYYQVSDGAAHAVHRWCVVRDRAVRAGQVPLLQLRRPGYPVLGPQYVREHLARVLRQRLVRGHRDREPRRREGRAALPPAQR